MAEDKVSEGGVFIDTKTGKVVESQPEEGVQLVPPGGVIDDATAKMIESVKNPPAKTEEDMTVTTQTQKASRRT